MKAILNFAGEHPITFLLALCILGCVFGDVLNFIYHLVK